MTDGIVQSDDVNEVYQVKHSLTTSKAHLKYKVILNKGNGSITCSCNLFGRHGYLCRRIFCILKSKNVHIVPDQYIMRRWRRNVLTCHQSDKQHRFVNKHAEVDEISSQAISGVELCLSRLRHDTVMFASFVDKVNKLSESTLSTLPRADLAIDDEQVFMHLLGVSVHEKCNVFAPKDVNNKGSGRNTKGSGRYSGKRFVDPGEKHVKKRQRLMFKCTYCKEIQDNHNIRNCKIKKRDEAKTRTATKRAKQG